jgi:DNA-binding transcriptional MerR regulator/methylmalonyl-CoA mutase cobalamin-binding subunit
MSTVDSVFNIAAVERETGLSKDVLRKWESRYGFPAPARGEHGERLYSEEQVARLCLIKRLMDTGLRPSRLVDRSAEELRSVIARPALAVAATAAQGSIEEVLECLRGHDAKTLRRLLGRLLQEQGLRRFVQDVIAPLSTAVGEAWARGELHIHQEHLYTEMIQGLLRAALDPLDDPDGRPRVLMTTVPEEAHSLGLLMAAAILSLGGAHCIFLGAQTPLEEIRGAAMAHAADVVALSFSAAYPRRRIPGVLSELRQRLDAEVAVWGGGNGTLRLADMGEGIHLLPSLDGLEQALATWRETRV